MVDGKYWESGPASRVVPRLWQGGYPRDPNQLRGVFDLIVLAAYELQPGDVDKDGDVVAMPPEVEVVCAPLDDVAGGPSPEEVLAAVRAANRVLVAHRAGKRVLVTCAAGRNRSGLVTALALTKLLGLSGKQARERVQAARPNALTNRSFAAFLDRIP